MTKPPRRSRRSRTSCFFTFFVGLIALFLAGGAAFAWFYQHPISNQALHDRVLRRLERLSGLDVRYDSASLVLSTGQYHITNLRFTDPQRPDGPVLTVGEVFATIHPWELLTNPESSITKVVLKNPSPLDLVYTQDSLKLGRKSSFLLDAVKKAQPPGHATYGQLPFDEMKIEDVTVAFTESAGILPDDTPPTASMRMTGEMLLRNKGADTLDVDFTGEAGPAPAGAGETPTTSTLAAGVKTSFSFGADKQVAVKGHVSKLALHEIFRDMPQSFLQATQVSFDFVTSGSAGQRTVAGDASIGEVDLVMPEKDVRLHDENLEVRADLDLNTSSGVAAVRPIALTSNGARVSLQGTAAYKRKVPSGFDMAVVSDKLDEDYRQILERFLPEGWDFEAPDEGLGFDLKVSSREGIIQKLDGSLALRGIKVKTPTLPASLENLAGNLQFSESAITFKDVTGDYAGTRVALDGSFDGDVLSKQSGRLSMNWSAIVDIDRVMKLHGDRLGKKQGIAAAGRVNGHGTWVQDINLVPGASSGVPEVEGGFDFENVSLSHPMLPAAVSELNGKAVVDDSRLEVKGLTGKMRGSEMQVDGFMEGKQFFWLDPQVSASLTSRLDLAQIASYLPAEQRTSLERYALSGQAETKMLVSGPFSDLGSNLTGLMSLENVSLSPQLEFMKGGFSGVSGLVRWNGSELKLDDLSGKLNDEALSLAGVIASNKISLRVKSGASLGALQQTFPELGKVMDMSGGLETDLDFAAGDTSASATGSLAEVLESARELLDRSVKMKSFRLNGQLRLKDANIRHIAMPMARKEAGRNIPEGRVTGMTGTVLVKNDVLSVPDDATISCSFADTKNCRLSGRIQLRGNDMPAMAVKISTRDMLKLDPWIMGWGKGLPHPATPPITGKKFSLDAEVTAPSIELRGQRGGRSRGKINFQMVQDKSPRVTRFDEVVVQGATPGSGRIVGSGRIDSYVWDTRNFPRWQSTVDVQSMPVENMLAAIFVQPTNIRGMANGKVELEGVGDDPRAIKGGGSMFMRNLEMGGTAVIRELGQTTGRNFGGQLFETARAAVFQVGNGSLSSRDVALQTNGLQLDMHGEYWFAADPSRGIAAKTINGSLRLRLFKSVFGSIPIIGQVAELADEVTNAFLLAFRVTGTAEQPRITPVPLPMFQGGS